MNAILSCVYLINQIIIKLMVGHDDGGMTGFPICKQTTAHYITLYKVDVYLGK
jgi:hypothetical protein